MDPAVRTPDKSADLGAEGRRVVRESCRQDLEESEAALILAELVEEEAVPAVWRSLAPGEWPQERAVVAVGQAMPSGEAVAAVQEPGVRFNLRPP
jgi:hypothetical protein